VVEPSPSPAGLWALQLQIQRMQREKEAILKELKEIEEQQNQDKDFLSRTTAGVLNTENTAANQTQQLPADIGNQLNSIASLLADGLTRQAQQYDEFKQRFRREDFLANLDIQPHSPRPQRDQQHAVQLIEEAAAATQGPPPPP